MAKTKAEAAAWMREWRKNNPERAKATAKRYREKNKDKIAESKKGWWSTEKGKAANKRWSDKNPDKVYARRKRWEKNNPEGLAAKQERRKEKLRSDPEMRAKATATHRAWCEQNRDAVNVLNVEFHRRKREKAAGRPRPESCECCGETPVKKKNTQIHWDHCHATGEFRGWLCARCNRVLGAVNDDVATLQKLISYLQSHSRKVA